MAHISPLQAPHFVATKTAEDIAKRLREDEELINAGQSCSWVAWYLKGYDTEKGAAVAACLASSPDLGHDIKRLIYDNLLRKIRQHLKDGGVSRLRNGLPQQKEAAEDIIPPLELSTALNVIVGLQNSTIIQHDILQREPS